MYQPPLCAWQKCSSLVPPSKNPGVKRKFCSVKCRRRYNAAKEYARERGSSFGIVLHDGIPWFNRIIATSTKQARKRLEEHNNDCVFSKTGDGMCPAMFDPYDRKRLCLIHAVLNEDWSQLMAAEESRPYKRVLTTTDGHWLSDRPEGGVQAVGKISLSATERDALIKAGAAQPESEG